MKLEKLFNQNRLVYSFEVFPPHEKYPVSTIYDTVEALADLNPDYISVTYGAGGTNRENRTLEVSKVIKEKFKIEPLAHLTCIGATKSQIETMVMDLKNNGIQNILAMRGDMPKNGVNQQDFQFASDLISTISAMGQDIHIVGACYPERHTECINLETDICNLKNKVDKGVSQLVSQLFFDNDNYFYFLDKIRKAGVTQPVSAGIMPIITKHQVDKMVNLCGAKIPVKYYRMLDKFKDNPIALRDAGVFYATEQIYDLVARGVDGIHLYTMNNPTVARKISLNINSLLK